MEEGGGGRRYPRKWDIQGGRRERGCGLRRLRLEGVEGDMVGEERVGDIESEAI